MLLVSARSTWTAVRRHKRSTTTLTLETKKPGLFDGTGRCSHKLWRAFRSTARPGWGSPARTSPERRYAPLRSPPPHSAATSGPHTPQEDAARRGTARTAPAPGDGRALRQRRPLRPRGSGPGPVRSSAAPQPAAPKGARRKQREAQRVVRRTHRARVAFVCFRPPAFPRRSRAAALIRSARPERGAAPGRTEPGGGPGHGPPPFPRRPAPPGPAAPPTPRTHLRQPRRPGRGTAGAAGSRAAGRGWRRSCSARSRSPRPARRGCRRAAAPAAAACCPCWARSGAATARRKRRPRLGAQLAGRRPPPRPGAPELGGGGGASSPEAAARRAGEGGAAPGGGRPLPCAPPREGGRAARHKTAPHVTPLPGSAGDSEAPP